MFLLYTAAPVSIFRYPVATVCNFGVYARMFQTVRYMFYHMEAAERMVRAGGFHMTCSLQYTVPWNNI
jgi:hypothetical protein